MRRGHRALAGEAAQCRDASSGVATLSGMIGEPWDIRRVSGVHEGLDGTESACRKLGNRWLACKRVFSFRVRTRSTFRNPDGVADRISAKGCGWGTRSEFLLGDGRQRCQVTESHGRVTQE